MPVSKPLPSYGEHFTWEEFREMCHDGSLIDYDGTATAATLTSMLDEEIFPSHVTAGTVDNPPSHVMWFNR